MVVVKYEGSLETLSFISDAINNVLNQLKDNDEILLTHQYTFDDNNSIFIDLTDFIMIKDTTNFRTAYSYLVNTITNTLFKYIIENYKLKSSIDNDEFTYQLSEGQDLYNYLSNSIKKEISMTKNSENSEKIYNLAVSDNFINEDENSEENFIKGSIYPNNDFKNFKKNEILEKTEEITSHLEVPNGEIKSNIKILSRTKSVNTQDFKPYFKSLGYLHNLNAQDYSNHRFSVTDIVESYSRTIQKKNLLSEGDYRVLRLDSHSEITDFLRKKTKNKGKGQKSYTLVEVISIVAHFYLVKEHKEDLKNNAYYRLVCSNHKYSLSDVLAHNYLKSNISPYSLFDFMCNNKNKSTLNNDRSKLNQFIIDLVANYMIIKHKGSTIINSNDVFAYKTLDCYFNISFTYLLEFYSNKLQLLTLKLIEAHNKNDDYKNYQSPSLDIVLNLLDKIIAKVKHLTKNSLKTSIDISSNSVMETLQSFYNLNNLDNLNHSYLMTNHFSIYPNRASLN